MDLNLSLFALVGVMLLVLSSISVVYLLRVENKTRATYSLLWFFVFVILSSIATILTNLGTIWDWAFAPLQDAMLIIGGIFLLQFAYFYPSDDQPGEARRVIAIYGIIALADLGYAISYTIKFLADISADIDESPLFYLITPLLMLFIVSIFFRRSLHWSAKQTPSSDKEIKTPKIKTLFKPLNLPALALRNFGLALSLGLIPAVGFLISPYLPNLISNFIFNFGVVMAIGTIMLAYLTYALEPSRISAKFIGISLITDLLILGAASVWVTLNVSNEELHGFVLSFIALVLISTIFILTVFPIFFRTTLLEPINRLLDGVRAANEGDLNIQVDVRYDDEVGFLTTSFNRMIHSLKFLTNDLQNHAMVKEREVAERTLELVKINQQLATENTERKIVEAQLEQMLGYEQALASCSQVLLAAADQEDVQKQILTNALEQLRVGTNADRAYVFRNFLDPQEGECLALYAETCGEGVTPALANPYNQKVPWSFIPQELPTTLRSGKSIGGPTERFFSGHPFMEELLSQSPPLYSLLLFPIFLDDQWWGVVGFDDCETPREWGESEVVLLRTASEMISRSIQRWKLQKQLLVTLEELEERVTERTQSLSDSNLKLNEEVTSRKSYQKELEQRLNTEKVLARISVRLLETTEMQNTMESILQDLAEIVQAESIDLALFQTDKFENDTRIYNRHTTAKSLLDSEFIDDLQRPGNWFWNRLRGFQMVFIEDVHQLPQEASFERELLKRMQVNSLIIMPIKIEDKFGGILLCSNILSKASDGSQDMQAIEVFINLLSSQIQRENLLRTLEQRVSEQTRELSNLYEMTILGGGSRDIADILYPALSRIQEITRSEAACIHFYSSEEQTLQLVAHHGVPQRQISKMERILIQGNFTDWLDDLAPYYDLKQQSPAGIPKEFDIQGFRSLLIGKLRAAGSTQGIISCYRVSDQPYTLFQNSMMEIIGEFLGVVVENQRLTQEAEKLATLQERQRLARELHDAVSQSVYSLTLFARSAKDALEVNDKGKVEDNLVQIEANALLALKEMRLLLYQLRSLALMEGDLTNALEARFDLVERRSGIQAQVNIDDHIKLPPQLEQEFFRLITEALNNSISYAQASQVTVKIRLEKKYIVLAVEDDGIGFDPSQVRAGMGLQNMRERAAALNGMLEIRSQKGHGTQIRLLIPRTAIVTGDSSNGREN